ncbi:hypothetical protein CDAR_299261, partial [Caerostris darwini]
PYKSSKISHQRVNWASAFTSESVSVFTCRLYLPNNYLISFFLRRYFLYN